MPGPLLSGTISESIRRGPLTGSLFILGHGILELILITTLFLGLTPILVQEEVFTFIALAGGGFMIFMAAGKLGLSGVIIFFAGHILDDAMWYVFVSASVLCLIRFTGFL